MANLLKLQRNLEPVPATVLGPKPGDFPVGSIQSRAAARALLANHAAEQAQDRAAELVGLSPYVRAMIEDVDPEIVHTLIGYARHAEELAEMFGSRLETPEEIRHLKKVANLANEMTEGQLLHFGLADPSEESRIRQLAEDVLQGKRAMTDKEIVAVREKYSEE